MLPTPGAERAGAGGRDPGAGQRAAGRRAPKGRAGERSYEALVYALCVWHTVADVVYMVSWYRRQQLCVGVIAWCDDMV